MNAADRTLHTSAALNCWVMTECRETRPETISAQTLASVFHAPPTAKQPQTVPDTKVNGRWWSFTRTRAGTGAVVWLARPLPTP